MKGMSTEPTIQGVWPDGTQWWYRLQTTQKMTDSCKAVFGLYINDQKILLTENHRGWDIPGGMIEQGETPEKALKRELLEECGFTTHNCTPIGYLELIQPGHNTGMIVQGYIVEGPNELKPVTAIECTRAGHFTLDSNNVKTSQKYLLIAFLYKIYINNQKI